MDLGPMSYQPNTTSDADPVEVFSDKRSKSESCGIMFSEFAKLYFLFALFFLYLTLKFSLIKVANVYWVPTIR